MSDDSLLEIHKQWIGYVQPVGLLVAPAALVHRGIIPDRNVNELQERLDVLCRKSENSEPGVQDFREFATAFLGWQQDDLAGASGGPNLPDNLCIDLIEYNDTLAPTYAVPSEPGTAHGWQMLVRTEPMGEDFDASAEDDGKKWCSSPHVRFERLLRETNIPVGLMTNGRSFRLIYAPKGETSGFATFDISAMLEVSGRPMLAAFHMLLRAERLFGIPEQTLPSLLAESRQYQETVSTTLSEQVLVALNELLRGFHAADTRIGRTVTTDLAKKEPDHLYAGLLTALLRLVFILYAEDRDLFPRDEVWERNYSLGGLFERLRHDASMFPDTMDDRYGAWLQLIALWRLMYFGGKHGSLNLVARRGQLFDPDRFPFLEGRTGQSGWVTVPPIADGVVWRILRSLMLLDGERLSYRTLDVEQIGSVYQSVMGFTIELTTGTSVAIRAPKRGGAATTLDLDRLLNIAPAKRVEWIRKQTDRKVPSKQAALVKTARSGTDLETALSASIDQRLTPKAIPAGLPVLQPTQTRRRTGSHYTPRQLTAPIVAEALRPAFTRLGEHATAEEILNLKVLDPALGSGAFLVEACRQIAEKLVQAWEIHGNLPRLPLDEDALLYARRLIAQRCLYGVDRNAMAADLAKLSLWLATLAKDHEFTFVDHAIQHGDALVGLFREQIAGFTWKAAATQTFAATIVNEALTNAKHLREKIQVAPDAVESELNSWLSEANEHLADVKLVGDTLVDAFFSNDKPRTREQARKRVELAMGMGDVGWQARMRSLQSQSSPLSTFHWEVQFPEVFLRDNPGFDVIIGNPPYAGKNNIVDANPENYLEWLLTTNEGAHGNADLVAYFFRRAFRLLREGGTLGLIATNTIRQGDTRSTGLRWIRANQGTIYSANRRFKWPGEAAVVVSVIHVAKGSYSGHAQLDGRDVPEITAFLFDKGGDNDPRPLAGSGQASIGFPIYGSGFLFSDEGDDTTPLETMRAIERTNPGSSKYIFPYLSGKDFLRDPQQAPSRYVICFQDFDLAEAQKWPELLAILREKVLPERQALPNKKHNERLKTRWWLWENFSRTLFQRSISGKPLLMHANLGPYVAFSFVRTPVIIAKPNVAIDVDNYARFAVLQSRVHEVWVRFFASTLEDRIRYTPTDVYETFPFPARIDELTELATIGEAYFTHRAAMMLNTRKGLTESYNRFNDSTDQSNDIKVLRDLHAQMDRAALNAYGWPDLRPEPDFAREWQDGDEDAVIRFRWPDDIREIVLARLLILNTDRADEEQRLGIAPLSLAGEAADIGELEEV